MGPRQKSSLTPVLRACHSESGLGSRSSGAWGFGRRRLSGPIPDPQNQDPPLKKDFRQLSRPWRVWPGGGGEAADEEKLALTLYREESGKDFPIKE